MFDAWFLILVLASYLVLLFSLAAYSERRGRKGRGMVANPYVYTLSLAVYCTSWTFYGSVGKAAGSGWLFLTIYLGPTLTAAVWWVLLRKMIKIAREGRITTIADFIGYRYGNSLRIAALVTVVAAIGIGPYLGLQIKAVTTTFSILSGVDADVSGGGWVLILVLAIFAMTFGVRGREMGDKHEGLVFAVAFESLVKLAAFLLVGLFVCFVLFDSPAELFARARAEGFQHLIRLGDLGAAGYTQWASLLVLSMSAILFLPRQFHMAVVENHNLEHVRKAMWLFPLYLLLINIFVMPVALAGLLLGGSPEHADSFVLSLPLQNGWPYLALFVFVGGFSAASAMVIVESLAISNMIMNTIINPMILRYNKMRGYPFLVANARRVAILLVVLIGYFFAVEFGKFTSLVDMGLISFEAVALFAPSILLGMYWKRGNRNGALMGLAGGFCVWFYTLILPDLEQAGLFHPGGFTSWLLGTTWFNPSALFGVTGLDKWSHALFWGLLVNTGLYVAFSLFTPQSEGEQYQALKFVESFSPRILPASSNVDQIEDVLVRFVGREEGETTVAEFMARHHTDREKIGGDLLFALRDEARRVLSGSLGSGISNVVFQEKDSYSALERRELLNSITLMRRNLRLSRRELAEANQELALLKEFSENIVESLPQGVATLDDTLAVRSWNHAMTRITGVPADEALGQPAPPLLQMLGTELFEPELKAGPIRMAIEETGMFLEGHVRELAGAVHGFVIVLDDVSDRRKMEEDLINAAKHASIGRLAAGVSHEIGNPLASISSLVQEMLEEDNGLFVAESLVTVNGQVDRIARIVRSLGEFARVKPRRKVPFKVETVLRNTLNLVRFDKGFRKIQIVEQLAELPVLSLDPDQMQQVFLNLLLNARDAMPDGGTITLTSSVEKGEVVLSFADNGHGMDAKTREMIFDPFFSTKGPGKGTGLGLSVSYGIIEDHMGRIEVTSAPASGTCFTLYLPIEGEPDGGNA